MWFEFLTNELHVLQHLMPSMLNLADYLLKSRETENNLFMNYQ